MFIKLHTWQHIRYMPGHREPIWVAYGKINWMQQSPYQVLLTATSNPIPVKDRPTELRTMINMQSDGEPDGNTLYVCESPEEIMKAIIEGPQDRVPEPDEIPFDKWNRP